MSASGVAEHLSGSDRDLLALVHLAEQYRIIPDTRVSDLARRVAVDPDPYSWSRRADPRLWPELRHANGLEDGSEPSFRAAVDVTMASAAFIARYPHLIGSHGDDPTIEPIDRVAAGVLTEALCRASSGPYPTPSQAISSLSALAPLTFDVISDYLRSGPVGSNAVRALDRALRVSGRADGDFRRAAELLIARPPGLLFRNALWMRAVRRVMWSDRRRGVAPKPWAMTQAMGAMRREDAYAWSGHVERRYALWVYAEFSDPNAQDAWYQLRTVAKFFGDHLIADLDQAREYMAGAAGGAPDLFFFRPVEGWSAPTGVAEVLTRHLRPARPAGRTSRTSAGVTIKSGTRIAAAELASEALLAPCAIRHRTAVDTLQACIHAVHDEVAMSVAGILRDVALTGEALDPALITLVERCVHLLGALRSAESIDVIEDLLRARYLPVEVVKVAILAAGQLATIHGRHQASLIGHACAAAEVTRDDTCIAAAIHSCVSVAINPLHRLDHDVVRAAGPGCAAMLNWAIATLADPLFRRHTGPRPAPAEVGPDYSGW